ncbi:hypothetical protein ACFQFQ_18360 [Sulfitobacter porphyrae]|uniref:Uncharacterized protein n=1 Tax=Sulfitobacter porphyrae TaxID=1246864 RepID=A0ABW2B725_9RHOB
MLKSFSKSCIALAALTAISLPLTEANAKQTRMVVRNDPFSSSNLVVPKGYYPPLLPSVVSRPRKNSATCHRQL